MAGRTVYSCLTCQPLRTHVEAISGSISKATISAATARSLQALDTEGDRRGERATSAEEAVHISPNRRKAMLSATPSIEFVSHCAPDDATDGSLSPAKMTVALLREKLSSLGLPSKGKKTELAQRLTVHLQAETEMGKTGEESRERAAFTSGRKSFDPIEGEGLSQADAGRMVEELPTPAPKAPEPKVRPRSRRSKRSLEPDTVFPERYKIDFTESGSMDLGEVRPGIPFVDVEEVGDRVVATAAEAAAEKERAGENRAVEHVALFDEREAAAGNGKGRTQKTMRRKRKRKGTE